MIKQEKQRKMCLSKTFKEQGCDSAGKKHPDKITGSEKERLIKGDMGDYANTVKGVCFSSK